MRRFLRVRLFLILFALILAPAAVLPFAERLRTEWAKFWEPKREPALQDPAWAAFAANPPVFTNAIFLCPTDWSAAAAVGQAPVDAVLPIVVIERIEPVASDGDAGPWSEVSPDVPSDAVER